MIFISYAKEDHSYASKIFLAFKKAGLSPWMDKPPVPYDSEGLRVGQRWRSVLNAKLREASFILLVLSPTSVQKRGFVQTEFRTALSLMNLIPDDQIFILPVLSKSCKVPSLQVGEINLLDLQWEIIEEEAIDGFASRLAAEIEVA